MARVAGKGGTVTADSVEIKGVRRWELDYKGNVEDITRMGDQEDGIRQRFVRTGVGWVMRIEGYWETSQQVSEKLVTGEAVTVELDMTSAGKVYSGTAFITRYNILSEVAGAVEYRLEVQGTSKITISDT